MHRYSYRPTERDGLRTSSEGGRKGVRPCKDKKHYSVRPAMSGQLRRTYMISWMRSFILRWIHAQRIETTNAHCITRKPKMAFCKIGGGQSVFCNPPYSDIAAWVEKAYREAMHDNTVVVLLIPSRTDTKYFHDFIYHRSEIRFIRGRLKFGEAVHNASFPSMVVIFRGPYA